MEGIVITVGGREISTVSWDEQVDEQDAELPDSFTGEFLLQDDEMTQFLDIGEDSGGYFDLTLEGRDPIRVRWGRVVWQREAESTRRVLGTLVAESQDGPDLGPPGPGEPRLGNTSEVALRAQEGIAAVIDELQAAGALSEEAVGRIAQRMARAADAHWFELLETERIDTYR